MSGCHPHVNYDHTTAYIKELRDEVAVLTKQVEVIRANYINQAKVLDGLWKANDSVHERIESMNNSYDKCAEGIYVRIKQLEVASKHHDGVRVNEGSKRIPSKEIIAKCPKCTNSFWVSSK